jgi:predicted metal-binding membrane protein
MEAGQAAGGKIKKRRWMPYQRVILTLLILFTAIAWVYTIATSSGDMDGMVMDMGAGADPSMDAAMAARAAGGLSAPDFAMFVPMWIIMCVAMMLPTAIPMVYAYQALLHNKYKKTDREANIYTSIFVAGYILLWALFGIACWAVATLVYNLIGGWLGESSHAMIATGVLFVACGFYQVSRLKEACLKGCRHPVIFLINHWHDGYGGALRIGMTHGAVCVACCWALMVILFPLGLMNLLWMGLFTIIMYVEKNVRAGALISRIVGWLMVISGAVMTVLGFVFL